MTRVFQRVNGILLSNFSKKNNEVGTQITVQQYTDGVASTSHAVTPVYSRTSACGTSATENSNMMDAIATMRVISSKHSILDHSRGYMHGIVSHSGGCMAK
ncbi:hypothetical protein PHYSODRAFT_260626 [Phytophthora sojae]|uniref:Uncharacterized protein n=1 Tax=Phytophthora sojae (strain P6497) TaxID=1094619 RepID=G4ZCE4_PHYSP|nr:hypothetical protein PHYSODRAFT_260626 [Phytophthora sojae]EGZ16437.1 hypothetical protein PHYSODRAFT_260626 [Phytophthora sojae]|eukprot:XP_009525495.1 hypothetical protein PHYSODRAFT_260626 [Phytophthora sojae]